MCEWQLVFINVSGSWCLHVSGSWCLTVSGSWCFHVSGSLSKIMNVLQLVLQCVCSNVLEREWQWQWAACV